jgi:hypothetical protein
MSCNEWESGSFILSTDAYREFTSNFLAKYNQMRDEDMVRLRALREHVLAAGKSVPTSARNWRDIFFATAEKHRAEFTTSDLYQAFRNLMVTQSAETKQEEVGAPRRVTATTLPATVTKKSIANLTLKIDGCEATITFNKKKRTVGWDVRENNHACERARRTQLAKEFFLLLERVTWTRGTGGSIVGNDEYNRDNRGDGGGANFTKDRFGPLGSADLPRTFRKAVAKRAGRLVAR